MDLAKSQEETAMVLPQGEMKTIQPHETKTTQSHEDTKIAQLSIDDLKKFYYSAKDYINKVGEIDECIKKITDAEQKLERMKALYGEMDDVQQGRILMEQIKEKDESIKRDRNHLQNLNTEKNTMETELLSKTERKTIDLELMATLENVIIPQKIEHLNKTESKAKYFVRVINFLKENHLRRPHEIDMSRMDDNEYVDAFIICAHRARYSQVCTCSSYEPVWFPYGRIYDIRDYKFEKVDDGFRSTKRTVNNKEGHYYCPNIFDREVFSIDSLKCKCVFKELAATRKKTCVIL